MEEGGNAKKVKVFGSEDDNLKMLGELLSNKSSRDIIRLLIERETYTNEIAKKLDLRANLVIHHLKKLEELGLLEITQKKIVKNGHNHRCFRMVPNLFLSPNHRSENIQQNGILKKVFKESVKFAVIGFVASIVFISDIANFSSTGIYPIPYGASITNDPLIPALIVIILGLVIERILSKKKEKKG